MSTWQERADKVIAQGCCTYSKRADQFVEGVYPTHCDGGTGPHIYAGSNPDTLRTYIDFVCGLGSVLLGYDECHMPRTGNYSLPSTTEVTLAERLTQLFPCIDKLKFLKTGSEACEAAVRIARAYTGRMPVIGCGYHGWGNTFINAETPGAGTYMSFYVKQDSIADVLSYVMGWIRCREPEHGLAGVIVEPVMLDIAVKSTLATLRDVCTKHGIVLIFDEVITGFRTPEYCIANHFDIQPDIMCMGKALGNGHPLAVVGGKAEIMDTPDYFVSSTFAGEELSLRVAEYVLNRLSGDLSLQELWNRGARFQQEFNTINPEVQLRGIPTRAVWDGDETVVAVYCQEMAKKGYLLHPKVWFLMFAHTPEILAEMLRVSCATFNHIEKHNVQLEGELPKPVFKRN